MTTFNRHSVDGAMRAAFFAGANCDEYVKDADIDNPDDSLHRAYENWKKEFWAEEAEYWNKKAERENK